MKQPSRPRCQHKVRVAKTLTHERRRQEYAACVDGRQPTDCRNPAYFCVDGVLLCHSHTALVAKRTLLERA